MLQFHTYSEGYFHFFACGYQARVGYFHQCNDIFLRKMKKDLEKVFFSSLDFILFKINNNKSKKKEEK